MDIHIHFIAAWFYLLITSCVFMAITWPFHRVHVIVYITYIVSQLLVDIILLFGIWARRYRCVIEKRQQPQEYVSQEFECETYENSENYDSVFSFSNK